jgi:hypothetical protein
MGYKILNTVLRDDPKRVYHRVFMIEYSTSERIDAVFIINKSRTFEKLLFSISKEEINGTLVKILV